MKTTPLLFLCRERGITPTALGRKLKIDGSLMRRYAMGEHKPSPKRARKIAKYFKVEVSSLFAM
jgi:ribosome-binding protein aMBF1 (putative translation factor)